MRVKGGILGKRFLSKMCYVVFVDEFCDVLTVGLGGDIRWGFISIICR